MRITTLGEEMERYSQRHHMFGRGSSIVAAVSGGADSVCLFELLCEMREKWGLALYVAHVHHGIRGEEAERDAQFVEKLAADRHVPFCLMRANVPAAARERRMSEEEAGRVLRYAMLEQYRREVGADRIAVAHHQGDQAETVLFHLFRGSGPRGLSGIPPCRDAIIRPLLFACREEIEEELRRRGTAWRQDATNEQAAYARNRIRHEILALAGETINSAAIRHTAEAAEKMAAWCTYVEKMGGEAYRRTVCEEEGGIRLAGDAFGQEDPVMQWEILRNIFGKMIPGAKDVGQVHYGQVTALFSTPSGGVLDLPGGVRAERRYGDLFFQSRGGGEAVPLCVECEIPSRHIVEEGGTRWQFSLDLKNRGELQGEILEKDYMKLVDYDTIQSGLAIRNPREGDYFVMDGAGRKKRLSRHYIDKKVPRSLRQSQIVVADGNHVLWALPDRMSEACKITNHTERILVITKERIP